jgi:hypothetical protein
VNVSWGAVAALAFMIVAFVAVAVGQSDAVIACGFAAVAFAILSTRE